MSQLSFFDPFETYVDGDSSADQGALTPAIKKGPVVNKRPREGVQLCQVFHPDRPPKWSLVCFEPKLNGNRCRTEIRNGKAILLSSTGLPHYNVQHIIDELETTVKNNPGFRESIMLDGELKHFTLDFDTASGMLRNHTEDERGSGFYLHLWDAMPLKDFDARECTMDLQSRKVFLEEFLLVVNPKLHIWKNPYFFGPISLATQYAKKFVIEMEEEGIVMKNACSLYGFSVNGSKAPSWLKWKPKFLEEGLIQDMHDADMRITGAVEGRGKNAGMLGRLEVEGYLCDDGNISPDRDSNSTLGGQYLTSGVGTGPSNPERIAMWKQFQEGTLVGQIAELKYENVTKDNSLHHPVFYRLRPDKE